MIGASYLTVRRTLLATAVRLRPPLDFTTTAATVLDQEEYYPSTTTTSMLGNCSSRSFHSTTLAPVSKKKGFRPRRRSTKDYRPIKPGPKKFRDPTPGNDHKFIELTGDMNKKAPFGPLAQDAIEGVRRERQRNLLHKMTYEEKVEEEMRMLDYFLAEDGSTEDQVGERRALSIDMDTEEEREEFLAKMDQLARDANLRDVGADPAFEERETRTLLAEKAKAEKNRRPFQMPDFEEFGHEEEEDKNPEVYLDPNQNAYGEWSEMMITVDRNVKLWRGGRLESYRALVIGGNMNGCAGFGTGKSKGPIEAVAKASRACKRNIFFVDRYQGDGITRDLVGKQNSCKVVIRATDDRGRGNGLRGNPLSKEILKRFGIVNAQIKAYGRRTPYNVVQATFKALMTHESIEEIALKRGKRLISLERGMRLQI